MPHNFDIELIGQDALDSTNAIFEEADYNIRVQELTADDLVWCSHITNHLPHDKKLPWDHSGASLTDPESFKFSFKILDAYERPAGACICLFCPADNNVQAVLNIEMLQNFHIQDSILDGNTLRFALYAAVLFMVDTQCAGMRLISPINDEVADYYINDHRFEDITDGMKAILYRDAASLLEWFKDDITDGEPSAQVDAEQNLSDNHDIDAV